MRSTFTEAEPYTSPGGVHFRVFTAQGGLRALLSREENRWHLSLSAGERYPTWDELADARYQLLPSHVDVAIVLPPPEDYVNLRHVFHLYEVRDPRLPIDRGSAMPRTYLDGTVAL